MSLTPQRPRKRDRLWGAVTLERSRSRSALSHGRTGGQSSRTPSQDSRAATNRSSILADALEALQRNDRDTIRKLMPADVVAVDAAVQSAQDVATELWWQAAQKSWQWHYRGRQLDFSEMMRKVLRLLDRFKSAGDVVANVDPFHVGLPWAGVRIVLEVALVDRHQRDTLVTGIELALYMSNRLKVYLDLYSQLSSSTATNNFRVILTDLYVHILTFLAHAIRTQQKHAAKRLVQALWNSNIITKFEQDCDKLCVRASEEARLCGSLASSEARLRSLDEIHGVHKSVLGLHDKVDLSRLKTADEATYNSATEGELSQCLPDTRTDLLEQIAAWTADASSKRIFWLCGKAGTGKSTIARTVAKKLDDTGLLGASFFFKRGHADRSHAKLLFPTIARQLAHAFPEIKGAIAASLDKDSLLCGRSMNIQFERLLVEPLQIVNPGSLASTGVVIIIDALDECDSGESIKRTLLLLSRVEAITSLRLRIFVTSRPELPVELGFINMSGDLHHDVRLEEAQATSIEHDIRVFYEHQFTQIRSESSLYDDDLPLDWPGEQDTRILVNRALPLFIFAFTVSRYISANPRQNLATILRQSRSPSFSGLKGTYLPILDQVVASEGEGPPEERISEFKLVVGSIILLFNPLPTCALALLLGIEAGKIGRVLRPLHSVLNIPRAANGRTDRDLPITLFHLSFRDFLIDPDLRQENKFWIDAEKGHAALGMQCISLLESGGLKENICGVKTPGVRRSEVSQSIVRASIPETVAYACSYWAQHLAQSGEKVQDDSTVHRFLKRHLLHWMEALSWLNEASGTVHILNGLQLIVDTKHGKQLLSLLRDANRFALRNRFIIDEAPTQIYVSSLLFAPTTSDTRQIFGDSLRKKFDVMPRVQNQWGAERQRLEGHQDPIRTIIFSTDGSTVVSRASDYTVRLWDAATGEEKQQFFRWDLRGPIAVSHDGGTVAIGLDPQIVVLWDVMTGEEKQILGGQGPGVHALAFSLDDKTLASASADKSVTLWNVATGEKKKELWHDHPVRATLFLQDGRRMLLQSDKTVTLWNVDSGKEIHEFEFDSPIDTTAVSSDGRVVAVGLRDGTLRLWNAATGKETLKLEGHSDPICVLAFSQDCKLVASGCGDGTIRIWDTISGRNRQEMKAHAQCVTAIAFSPDGNVMASGSADMTIKLRDVSQDDNLQKIEAHAESVQAIAISPGGKLVVSASDDHVIRLWDARTGCEVRQLEVDDDGLPVRAVAFLRDAKAVIGLCQFAGTVRLWDTSTGGLEAKQRLEGYNSDAYALALSPDGKTVVAGVDKTVKAWDMATGKLRWTRGTSKAVCNIIFSDDGSRLETDIGQLDPDDGADLPSATSFAPQTTLSMARYDGPWIKYRGADFLWLPHEYRGHCHDTSGSTIAIGNRSGAVSIISFK